MVIFQAANNVGLPRVTLKIPCASLRSRPPIASATVVPAAPPRNEIQKWIHDDFEPLDVGFLWFSGIHIRMIEGSEVIHGNTLVYDLTWIPSCDRPGVIKKQVGGTHPKTNHLYVKDSVCGIVTGLISHIPMF